MMTKYVLNSGGLRNHPEKTKRFLAEIIKDVGFSPRMLITLFAQPREDWEAKFAQYQNMLNDTPEGIKISFELAYPDTFAEQVKNCDIVYIHGGDDHLLQYWFSQIDIPKIWQGKVVATSSAGSDLLATHFWPCDWRQCMDGTGILPIKFLAHFNSDFGATDPRGLIDWEEAYQELSDYGDKSLPIYAPEEGDYVVIEQ